MPIAEIRAQLTRMAERYRQMELDGTRVLLHSLDIERKMPKPRIRVKAISRRHPLPTPSSE